MSVYAVDDFSVSLCAGQGVVRVGLAGDLDYSSAHLLEPVAVQALRLGPLVVQIDVRRLWFCDVAGVRQIVDATGAGASRASASLAWRPPAGPAGLRLAGQADLLQPHRRTAGWK